MPNFTWNRYPIKNLLLDTLRTLIVESTYLKRIKMILSVADFWCALSYQNLCTVVSKSLHTLCIFLLYFFFFRSRIKISAHTLYFSSKGDYCHDCSAYLTCGNKSTVWSRQCHFCKSKIRNWVQWEKFLMRQTQSARITHGQSFVLKIRIFNSVRRFKMTSKKSRGKECIRRRRKYFKPHV